MIDFDDIYVPDEPEYCNLMMQINGEWYGYILSENDINVAKPQP